MKAGNINYRSISHGNSSTGPAFSKLGYQSETKTVWDRRQAIFCTAFSALRPLIRYTHDVAELTVFLAKQWLKWNVVHLPQEEIIQFRTFTSFFYWLPGLLVDVMRFFILNVLLFYLLLFCFHSAMWTK